MEAIEKFLAVDVCEGFGDGSGDGSGFGADNESGYGCGGSSGDGDVFGSGDDYVFSCSSGRGNGSGYGDGYGDGSGSHTGDGFGYGDDYGIKEINGDPVYTIDNVQTIIKSVRGNIAQGYIVHGDLTLSPCYIAKEQDKFAHGDTLHDAFNALQEKLYDDSTEEERIEVFVKKFPGYDTPYPNRDLFAYHHVLTGSCRMGRESFCKDRGLTLDGKTTVREFVQLTKDAYGGDIIKKLPSAYGIK